MYESLSFDEYKLLIDGMIGQCEKQEGIKRVEAFQKIQSQMNDICKRGDMQMLFRIVDLAFDNLDHPLTSVAAIAKGMMRKSMQNEEITKEQAREIVLRVQSRAEMGGKAGGYKSRYLALNLMVDYIEPYTYLAENPQTIDEIIESTLDNQQSGKYVQNFFEALLKKALSGARGSGAGTISSSENEKSNKSSVYSLTNNIEWFEIWIDAYLKAMRSTNDLLRDSVCTLITPIVIKVNKNSLPLILATVRYADPLIKVSF